MATIAALAVTVSACSHGEPRIVVRTVTTSPAISPEARQPCAKPVAVPDRDLTEKETFTGWNRDRSELVACETRRAAAIAAVDAVPVQP